MAMKAPKYVERSTRFDLADTSDDGFTMEGYGAVFGQATRIDSHEGRFDEVIDRGAFTKTLSERMPVLQFDHGRDNATGSVPIGAITDIHADDHGLFVRARMHDNARVEPIRQERADTPLRTLKEVSLFEVGPVVFPAYAGASVGVRSILATLPEAERAALIEEIRQAIMLDVPDIDAAILGTSVDEADAVISDTSVKDRNVRDAYIRQISLER